MSTPNYMDSLPKCLTVCSWCGAITQDGDRSLPASHGICPSCVRLYFPDHAPEVMEALAQKSRPHRFDEPRKGS